MEVSQLSPGRSDGMSSCAIFWVPVIVSHLVEEERMQRLWQNIFSPHKVGPYYLLVKHSSGFGFVFLGQKQPRAWGCCGHEDQREGSKNSYRVVYFSPLLFLKYLIRL